MQIYTEEGIRFNIEDSLKSNSSVALKIDAAHAGVMNGNFLFYLPKALDFGANSLKKFYKPLQQKHYSKTLGYIYDSEYVETNTKSKYYNAIVSSTDVKSLMSNVKEYMATPEYKSNKQGFGVLVAKAKLHDKNKIQSLQYDDTGTVSVAGDAGEAYCSICHDHIGVCGHKLGKRYKNELCFGVVTDDFEVDHISFETIPANWETKSLIIKDSQTLGNIELIEEGQLMKISLEQLKEKLGNIEAILTEFDLVDFLAQYTTEASEATNSQYLLAGEKLLPFNTPLTKYVTGLLLEQLEDSEDKNILNNLFGDSFESFKEKTLDEIKSTFTSTKEEPKKEEPLEQPKEQPQDTGKALEIQDANQMVLAITDSLSVALENSFGSFFERLQESFAKNNEAKANKILEDQLKAIREDLSAEATMKKAITDELKESIINQIVLLKNVDKESEYFKRLQTRTVQELKMTLEDHALSPTFIASKEAVVEKTKENLEIKDNLNINSKVDPVEAGTTMEEPLNGSKLEITDADVYVNSLVENTTEKLTSAAFSKLYKDTVLLHGTRTAKKLHSALKAQNKI